MVYIIPHDIMLYATIAMSYDIVPHTIVFIKLDSLPWYKLQLESNNILKSESIQLFLYMIFCDADWLINWLTDLMIQEETLETWMKTIDKQPFATTPEPLQLIDVVTSLVSRAQLIEWGTF